MRSASDSLASSDSSSPFASGAVSLEFPRSDNDEKLFQDDDESDMWGRGCYRFGVWKNVKVCPRHPAPCLYSGQLGPPVAVQQPANGDTELHNLAMCKSAQQCVQGCTGGGCTQSWLCKGGAGGSTQLAIAMACHTFLSSSPLQSMWIFKEENFENVLRGIYLNAFSTLSSFLCFRYLGKIQNQFSLATCVRNL